MDSERIQYVPGCAIVDGLPVHSGFTIKPAVRGNTWVLTSSQGGKWTGFTTAAEAAAFVVDLSVESSSTVSEAGAVAAP